VLDGIGAALARRGYCSHDTTVRRHEGLPLEVIRGAARSRTRYLWRSRRAYSPHRTPAENGAYIDQREKPRPGGEHTGAGRHGPVHLPRLVSRCISPARRRGGGGGLERRCAGAGREIAALNELTNITWRGANAFDLLRELGGAKSCFDTIVLDPPASPRRSRASPALAGYKEINLRAMRLVAPGGVAVHLLLLLHVGRAVFLDMLGDGARDAGRRLQLLRPHGAAGTTRSSSTLPETGS